MKSLVAASLLALAANAAAQDRVRLEEWARRYDGKAAKKN